MRFAPHIACLLSLTSCGNSTANNEEPSNPPAEQASNGDDAGSNPNSVPSASSAGSSASSTAANSATVSATSAPQNSGPPASGLPPIAAGEPEEVLGGLHLPGRIALDGDGIVLVDHVHYANPSASDVLLRVPKQGGSPTPLAHAASIEGFLLDGDRIWLSSYSEHAVIVVDRNSSERTLVIPFDETYPTQMAQTESHVYVSYSPMAAIARIDKSTGVRDELWSANIQGSIVWLRYAAANDALVFPLNTPDGAGRLLSVSSDGITQRLLAEGSGKLRGIDLLEQEVIFSDSAGAVARVPQLGGPAQLLAQLAQPWALLRDGDWVYVSVQPEYCNAETLGAVYAVPATGGTPLLLAGDQRCPSMLLADENSLYWVNNGDSQMETDGSGFSITPNGTLVKLPRE